jgi:hypothetical protein
VVLSPLTFQMRIPSDPMANMITTKATRREELALHAIGQEIVGHNTGEKVLDHPNLPFGKTI